MNVQHRHKLYALFAILTIQDSHALVITNEVQFDQMGLSMWKDGQQFRAEARDQIFERWDVSLPTTDIGVGKLAAFSKGGAGLLVGAGVSGGGIDLALPVTSRFELPDQIVSGQTFTVRSSGGLKNSAQITAFAPSFDASIYALVDISSGVSFDGKWFIPNANTGDKLNLKWAAELLAFDSDADKPLSIGGYDIPAIGYDKEYHIRGNTNVLQYTLGSGTEIKIENKPIIGDVELHKLTDQIGGEVTGNSISLSSNQPVFNLGISLPGFMETYLNSPGLLRNTIGLVPSTSLEYKLFDMELGPAFGMAQQFDFNTNLKLELQFDRPVTHLQNGTPGMVHNDGRVAMELGANMDLMFDGEVGDLLSYNLLMEGSTLRNQTRVTIDPYVEVQAFCLKITHVLSEQCLLDWREQTTGLASVTAYGRRWALNDSSALSFDSYVDFGRTAIPETPNDTPTIPETPNDTPTIPEPSSTMLILMGSFALMFIRRRTISDRATQEKLNS